MTDPPKVTWHKAAVADFTSGVLTVRTHRNEHLLITLGPAQIISAYRAFNKHAEQYGVDGADENPKSEGVWR